MYTTESSVTNDLKYSQYVYNKTISYQWLLSTHNMYTTEPSAKNDIKYLQYVYNITNTYQGHKVLKVCIQQNHQQPMT